MQDLQDDKRDSNYLFPSNRTSLRISTVTINSDTVLPPPVHFTTTIHDPPMPTYRNSKYYQRNLKNLDNSLETNTEENWSLLDNLSLYYKILFNNDNSNSSNVNKNDQKEEEIDLEQKGEIKYSNPLSKPYDTSWTPEPLSSSPILSNPLSKPYDTSWTPEPLSSSPILSRLSFFESNKSNKSNLSNAPHSPPSIKNVKKKVRFNARVSNYSNTDESQFQYDSDTDNYVVNNLSSREKGKKGKKGKKCISRGPKTCKELWNMSWRDEGKKFTKKFWLMFTIFICLILLLGTIGLCLILNYEKH